MAENDFSAHFDLQGIMLVYEKHELVGYSHVENRGSQLFIRMIVVHPHHQQKGVGRKLLYLLLLRVTSNLRALDWKYSKSMMGHRNAMKDSALMLKVKIPPVTSWHMQHSAFNLAPFGRWMLRDKATQRRQAQHWASRQEET